MMKQDPMTQLIFIIQEKKKKQPVYETEIYYV